MRGRHPWRIGAIVAVSILLHAGMAALLALGRPELRLAAPPPVMEVQVVPYFRPAHAQPRRPQEPLAAQPIRPRRAVLRPKEEQSTVAPLVTRQAPPPTASGPWAVAPPIAGSPAPPSADLRQALRRGPAGCANPSLLSKAEREACLEKLGAGAKDAPYIPPPIAADKLKEWDKAAAAKRAKWRAREAPMPQAVPQGPSSPSQAPNPFPEVWTPRQ